jgi:hypothetical protein
MDMRGRMGFKQFMIFQGIRKIIPILLAVAFVVAKLVLVAVISLIIGIPESTHRTAKELQEKAIDDGKLPSVYAIYFYWTVRVLATIVVFIGWVCFSFTTVYLIILFVN